MKLKTESEIIAYIAEREQQMREAFAKFQVRAVWPPIPAHLANSFVESVRPLVNGEIK